MATRAVTSVPETATTAVRPLPIYSRPTVPTPGTAKSVISTSSSFAPPVSSPASSTIVSLSLPPPSPSFVGAPVPAPVGEAGVTLKRLVHVKTTPILPISAVPVTVLPIEKREQTLVGRIGSGLLSVFGNGDSRQSDRGDYEDDNVAESEASAEQSDASTGTGTDRSGSGGTNTQEIKDKDVYDADFCYAQAYKFQLQNEHSQYNHVLRITKNEAVTKGQTASFFDGLLPTLVHELLRKKGKYELKVIQLLPKKTRDKCECKDKCVSCTPRYVTCVSSYRRELQQQLKEYSAMLEEHNGNSSANHQEEEEDEAQAHEKQSESDDDVDDDNDHTRVGGNTVLRRRQQQQHQSLHHSHRRDQIDIFGHHLEAFGVTIHSQHPQSLAI